MGIWCVAEVYDPHSLNSQMYIFLIHYFRDKGSVAFKISRTRVCRLMSSIISVLRFFNNLTNMISLPEDSEACS